MPPDIFLFPRGSLYCPRFLSEIKTNMRKANSQDCFVDVVQAAFVQIHRRVTTVSCRSRRALR